MLPSSASSRDRAVVTMIATHGVRRPGSTLPSTEGSSPSRGIRMFFTPNPSMPNWLSREDMMPVSRAPLATATRAIALNSTSGTPPATRTTSSSGPVEATSWSVGTTALAAAPTSP